MELAKISLLQVIILFIIIFFGFLLAKLKLISMSAKGSLSNLLVYLVVPAMIINSYITEYDSNIMKNLLYCFLFSFIVLGIGLIVVMIITKFWHTEEKPILRFAMIFSNAAYMGLPLIEAMYGGEGLIYASAFVSVFNILLWTFGYACVSKTFRLKEVVRSILKTPVIYALAVGILIFFLQIPVPTVIAKPLELIGSMNTPLSMIITGMVIASCNFKAVLKNIYLWLCVGIRLIVVPLLCLGVLYLIKIWGNADSVVLQIVFILEACPCAAITSIFAIKFKYNEDLAVCSVVFSTLLSIISLPLFTLLIANVL